MGPSDWQQRTTYRQGSRVVHDGKIWESLHYAVGIEPGTDRGETWRLVSFESGFENAT